MNNIVLRYFTIHLRNVLEKSQKLVVADKPTCQVSIVELVNAMAQEKGSIGYNLLSNLSTFKTLGKTKSGRKSNYSVSSSSLFPFSETAHKSILGAIKAAQEFEFPYVGTEHLLLAILENADQKVIMMLGNSKEEIKNLLVQLKKVMARLTEPVQEQLFIIDQISYDEKEKLPSDQHISETDQEFVKGIMDDIGEVFSSLVQKNQKEAKKFFPMGFIQPMRPSFGIMPQSGVEEKPGKKGRFLDYFGRDLNREVILGKIDPVIGREKEVDDLVCILMRRTKNNPVLVGEPGVGKTAVVAGLARKIVEKEVPPVMVGKRVITLDLSLMVAGTSFRGEFEDRFKKVITEAENDPNVILFIDELHNLIGAGSAQGSLDAANIIKPALARGDLHCIGATTVEEYHRYIEKDGALERRFQPVWVKEPSLVQTEKILKGIRRYYEDFHKVKISDRAIAETVRLASRYLADRFLPDKAIDLLDESSAFVIQDEHRQGTTKKLQRLEMQLDKLRQMKEKMVQEGNLEMAASLFKSEKELKIVILELEKKVLKERQFIPVVDDRDVAEVLARKLNIPLELIMESPTQKLSELAKELSKKIKGQPEVIDEVAATLKRSLAGIADPDRPATAFLFVGPTGVGKTYLAKILAKELFVKPDALIRIDMSEFNEKHTVSRLLGSPPGYVGYGDMNNFTDRIRKNPYSLILFDEIEKAHPEVFHILLQVLEDGFLTDGLGRKINFRNSLIIFTSNLGNNEFLRETMGFDQAEVGQPAKRIGQREKNLIKQKLEDFLKPEFLNRLSNVVYFKPLGKLEICEIAVLEIKKLKKRLLATKKIILSVDKKMIMHLAKKSLNKKEGVRILRRLIQQEIEEPIAQQLLAGKIEKGSSVCFSPDEKRKQFILSIERPKKPEIYPEKSQSATFASKINSASQVLR
jgi:ATP-dependent Clp protease ATP-binding subunit ClpC